MRAPVHPTAPAPRPGERGSAYLFALLVLVLLTIIGLSLAVITQTEVQIGAAEKSSTRVLYAGDAGVRIQLAAFETTNEAQSARYVLDTKSVAGTTLTESVDVAPFLPMYLGPCSLCTVNLGSENKKFDVNFVTNAQGQRLSSLGEPQATKLVTFMMFTQPSDEPPVNEALRTFDPNNLVDNPASVGLDVIRY
jgi:Tfp pilus assembly protein PilX